VSVEAFPPNYRQLAKNTATLKDVVTPVARAIVAHPVALSGEKMNFTGDANQFWGFRVDHTAGAAQRPQQVTQQVDTVSLVQLQARFSLYHVCLSEVE
jgi:hypothetical protein